MSQKGGGGLWPSENLTMCNNKQKLSKGLWRRKVRMNLRQCLVFYVWERDWQYEN